MQRRTPRRILPVPTSFTPRDGALEPFCTPGDDRLVHTARKAHGAGHAETAPGHDEDPLVLQGVHEREVVAAEAERESIKYKVIEYMQDKIGMEFNGTISSLTEWGMYVEVEDTHIEGMIPLRTIRSDFYDFDPDRYLVRGRRTGHVFRLGDPVRIRVKESNLEQRLLDYELIEERISAPDEHPSRFSDERPSRFSDDKPSRPEGEYHHYRSGKGSRKGFTGSKSASRSGKSRKK